MKSTYEPGYTQFLAHLADARQSQSITQAELATRLGRPQSYISKVESGQRRLDLVEFVHWMNALGSDPASLVDALSASIRAGKRLARRRLRTDL